MNEKDLKSHAARIIMDIHEGGYEYSNVYEDVEMDAEDEQVWDAVYSLMNTAKITIKWD